MLMSVPGSDAARGGVLLIDHTVIPSRPPIGIRPGFDRKSKIMTHTLKQMSSDILPGH